MRRQTLSVCFLLAAAGTAPAQQAEIVFIGTVTRVGAASFTGVPVSPRTMVVQVDAVVEKPAAVVLGAGDLVTVEGRTPQSLREGMQATFYANGWIFGRGVAVREVGHDVAAAGMRAGALGLGRDSILRMRRQVTDSVLRTRIRTADMVVVGRVEAVNAASLTGPPRRVITEHDPAWQDAVILVESPIKGAEAGQRVVVRFPGSLDVAWHAMPRFAPGQEGTFLLRQDRISGSPTTTLGGRQVTVYVAPDGQDVLTKQDAQRVQALSKP